jgi:hypothetical protein
MVEEKEKERVGGSVERAGRAEMSPSPGSCGGEQRILYRDYHAQHDEHSHALPNISKA